MIQRYAIGIEYDGTHYSGWQRQSFYAQTIQEKVEDALAQIANHRIDLTVAGRTDAGVHALGQVAHFDTCAKRADFSWLAGANRYLPYDIRLQWIRQVSLDFHARHSACARSYRYVMIAGRQPSALWHKRAYWHAYPLDIAAMEKAAAVLIGEHDFSAFRASECQSATPYRHISKIEITADNTNYYIDITGNAFLHHMVRNIVGTLLPIGDGRHAPERMGEILRSKNRCQAGVTAPAHGLYFVAAHYADFSLPTIDLRQGWAI